MSNNKHTAETQTFMSRPNGLTNGYSVFNADNLMEDEIARVNPSRSDAKQMATLLAASPLLLEALQRFVKFADKRILESEDKYESSLVLQAKAAIKAATN